MVDSAASRLQTGSLPVTIEAAQWKPFVGLLQGSQSTDMQTVLTIQALAVFIFLDLSFYFRGFEKTERSILRRAQTRLNISRKGRVTLASVVAAVDTATRYYYRRRLDCLPRALTMYYLARRLAIPVELCYGVKKFPFAGHTWVEYRGQVVGESVARVKLYTVLARH